MDPRTEDEKLYDYAVMRVIEALLSEDSVEPLTPEKVRRFQAAARRMARPVGIVSRETEAR